MASIRQRGNEDRYVIWEETITCCVGLLFVLPIPTSRSIVLLENILTRDPLVTPSSTELQFHWMYDEWCASLFARIMVTKN